MRSLQNEVHQKMDFQRVHVDHGVEKYTKGSEAPRDDKQVRKCKWPGKLYTQILNIMDRDDLAHLTYDSIT